MNETSKTLTIAEPAADPPRRGRWNFRLARILGIEVRVHATFLALVALLVFIELTRSGSAQGALLHLAAILALFLCVLLHEYGHALVARRFGIPTRSITLLPIGGVAELERMPEEPRQELAIALAGPAVNAVLAALTFALLGALHVAGAIAPSTSITNALWFFALVNVSLFLFNLLPALPMDGGRVLRALMALRLSYTRATVIAAGIGKGFAALFAVAGLFLNPILLLIALFVWLGARQEGLLARLRASMSGANVTNAMYTHFETLAASESVGSAAARMIRSPQQDYPVLDGERLIGVLGQREAVELLARGRRDVRLAQVVAGNVSAARPTDDLETVGLRVLAGRNAAVAVVDGIQVIGMVTRESLREFLALREAHARTPTAA